MQALVTSCSSNIEICTGKMSFFLCPFFSLSVSEKALVVRKDSQSSHL